MVREQAHDGFAIEIRSGLLREPAFGSDDDATREIPIFGHLNASQFDPCEHAGP